MTTTLKPPIAYYGGKTLLAERIAGLLPEHGHYVEPFAGSLAVLLARPPAKMETVNDLDGLLMTFWRVLRDTPDELVRVCALTPHSRAEYAAAATIPEGLSDLETARRVWVSIAQGRAGTLRNTGWRHYLDPDGGGSGMPTYLRGYVDRMAAAAERLTRVSLESRPAVEVINAYNHPNTLLYVAPPYLGGTRSGSGYRCEMKSESAHRELAEHLHNHRGVVVLSGYASALYDRELYAGWFRHELNTQTMQGGGGKRPRTEVLWSNRPLNADQPLPGLDLR